MHQIRFRLGLLSAVVTSNDLEPRDGHYFALFQKIQQLWSVVEVRPRLSATSIYPKASTFRQYMMIYRIRDY